jgi:hypothetical protein
MDEVLDFKEIALKEFIKLEKLNLSFDLHFMVFRSRKILEE